MNYLLDTHLLLWAASDPARLPASVRQIIEAPDNELYFSTACIWEVVIKRSLKRADFSVDANIFRRGLLDSSYIELPIQGQHALAVAGLPNIHRDPFDRIQIAQARADGMVFVTSDETLKAYGDPVRQF
ncbi:MAG: type II toxin-antitoxin system VapC family toxin [Burkholderiaceae bacterium]